MRKKSEAGEKSQNIDMRKQYNLKRSKEMKCPLLVEEGPEECNTGGNSAPIHQERAWMTTFCKCKIKPGNFNKCPTYKAQMRRERAPLYNKFIIFSLPIIFSLVILLVLSEAGVITDISGGELLISTTGGSIVGFILSLGA